MGQVMGHGSQALQPLSSSLCATAPPPSLGCLQVGLFPEDPDWRWAEFKQPSPTAQARGDGSVEYEDASPIISRHFQQLLLQELG